MLLHGDGLKPDDYIIVLFWMFGICVLSVFVLHMFCSFSIVLENHPWPWKQLLLWRWWRQLWKLQETPTRFGKCESGDDWAPAETNILRLPRNVFAVTTQRWLGSKSEGRARVKPNKFLKSLLHKRFLLARHVGWHWVVSYTIGNVSCNFLPT